MKNDAVIGVLCSVEGECGRMRDELRRPREARRGNVHFTTGSFRGRRVVIGIAGIGKANAAHGCTLLIERFRPRCVLNLGVGGCYPGSGLRVGDVAAAAREIYADEGVEDRRGFRGLEATGIPVHARGNKKFFNVFPADAALMRRFRSAVRSVPVRIGYGNFLTVSTVTGRGGRARVLRNRYRGICENMEGAAVFHIAHVYGIPCFAVRGISNIVEDRDRRKWQLEEAATAAQAALGAFIEAV